MNRNSPACPPAHPQDSRSLAWLLLPILGLLTGAALGDEIDTSPPDGLEIESDIDPARFDTADDLGVEAVDFEEAGGSILPRPTVRLETDWFAYYHATSIRSDQHVFRADLRFDFEGTLGSNLSYLVSPEFRIDSGDNGVNRFEFREDGMRRPLATFREAALSWAAESLELSAGKQVFNWGVADAWNPVDDLNPWDYLDVPTAGRTGIPAVSLYHLRELFEIEGVWAPLFTPSRIPLPGIDNRWLPDPSGFGRSVERLETFAFDGRELPSDRLDSSQFGARVSSSTLIDGWDVAVVYYRGNQKEGVFRADPSAAGIRTAVEYPRYHEIGGSFSSVLGSWQIHGEGSYHKTDEETMDDDYVSYVVGVNRSFSESQPPFVEETILILEYAGEEIIRSTPAGSPYFGSRQFSRPFEDALVASLTFKFSEDTQLEVGGSYDFADSGSFFEAELSHKFTDSLRANVGTNFFSGPQDSFFGKWGNNDRLFLGLALTW